MIEAVCIQANKLYRLWLARNPDFEKHGRVHIIGHSVRFTSTRPLTSAWFGTRSTYPVESAYKDAVSVSAAQTSDQPDARQIFIQHEQPLPVRKSAGNLSPSGPGATDAEKGERKNNV
jgi:hypothetical protein